MKFELTKPCGNLCPFRTDCLKGWLGRDRAQEIANALDLETFPCHKTTEFDEDNFESIPHPREQHCAGALIMREKMNEPGQMMQIAERLGLYDPAKLDMKAKVFGSAEAFVDHHADIRKRPSR